MADNPRIEELKRRVQKDPASIAFAQLAEEYRRSANYEEAIAICRAGLITHPSYLSARVTLGRALIEVNELDTAETELRFVLDHAPENLAAIRGLAEIHHRRGDLNEALSYYKNALGLARHDPDLEQAVDEISRAVEPPPPAPEPSHGLSFEEASAEFMAAAALFEPVKPAEPAKLAAPPPAMAQSVAPDPEPVEPALPSPPPPQAVVEDPVLPRLENFLDAIHDYRQRRAV